MGFAPGQYKSVGSDDTIPPEVQKQFQAIDQNTGTKQTVAMVQTVVAPVTGQPNDTPDDSPDGGTFDIDGYRNGNPDDATSEGFNARTLADDDDPNDDGTASSMTLRAFGDVTDGFTTTDFISAYSRFFLQSVSEPEQEKYQVVETFTAYYAFFFGKRPPIYRYTGLLLSDKNYRWNNDFKFVYENFFRGTSAVELSAEVVMLYGGRMVIGFPISLVMDTEAANPKGTPFAMDLLVVEHTPISFSIDIAGLLQSKQKELASLRNSILATQQTLAAGAGPAVTAADGATNGLTPPSSFSSLGSSAISGNLGVSQLSVLS
jgi:hypothetical protein